MLLKPRKYQIDALEYALHRQRSVCCLPTGTGKTLVGALWLQALFKNGAIHRALILEPTRLLVSQVDLYYKEKMNIETEAIDGHIRREDRRLLWQKELVVATPEVAYNDKDWLRFDAVIIDECHHTVGQDAFAKLMDSMDSPHRLGLSATVPQKRMHEIEKYIGHIRQWSWSDPEIEKYMPDWIGEVYEAELNKAESQALELIYNLPSKGFSTGLLERFLTRDGALALAETLRGHGKLATEFGPLIMPLLQGQGDQLHKLAVLRELLDSHDFRKAIIFVERRTLAKNIAGFFGDLDPVLFLGRSKADQRQALEQAKMAKTRLIIATSAGEEGIDLPEADLLVAWGSVASEVRFIQRHGRIMRKSGDGLKFATFIVTPGTSDFDSFVKGLERAQASGQINIEKAFGWEPSILWPKTTWWHVTESLRGHGQSLGTIGKVLGVREQMVSRIIQGAVKRGRIFYIYDVFRIANDVARWYLTWFAQFPDIKPIASKLNEIVKEFGETPSPLALSRSLSCLIASCPPEIAESLVPRLRTKLKKFSTKAISGLKTLNSDIVEPIIGNNDDDGKFSKYRIYLLSEDAEHIAKFLPNQVASYEDFSQEDAVNAILLMGRIMRGGIKKVSLSGFGLNQDSRIDEPHQFWKAIFSKESLDKTPGYTLGFRSPTLEYYFLPRNHEVLTATICNMCGLLRWRDILIISLNKCSQCGRQGAWMCSHCNHMLCSNCWKADPIHGGVCWQLDEFGPSLTR